MQLDELRHFCDDYLSVDDFEDYSDPEPTPMAQPPVTPVTPEYAGTGTEQYEVFQDEPAEEETGGGNRNKIIIGGCGCLVVFACIVVAGVGWYIDSQGLWCDILPFLGGC